MAKVALKSPTNIWSGKTAYFLYQSGSLSFLLLAKGVTKSIWSEIFIITQEAEKGVPLTVTKQLQEHYVLHSPVVSEFKHF